MANTRELRRRIKSIKNTAQITKAMQMVAATKMRRAQNQALNGRPYSLNLDYALEKLIPLIDAGSHPLLAGNGSETQGIVLLSTDKSLCGALNTNLFRLILASHLTSPPGREAGGKVVFYTVGKKGRNFIARTGKNLLADFENPDTISFRQAVQLSKLIVDSFLAGEIGEAFLLYPQFVSTMRQESTKVKLLPIDLGSVIPANAGIQLTTSRSELDSRLRGNDRKEDKRSNGKEFLFEPDPDRLLDYILVHHIQIKIYQALLETKASEHSARMIAMQSATDNAMELVDDLKLTYNQIRQDSITNELLEITTASLAMN